LYKCRSTLNATWYRASSTRQLPILLSCGAILCVTLPAKGQGSKKPGLRFWRYKIVFGQFGDSIRLAGSPHNATGGQSTRRVGTPDRLCDEIVGPIYVDYWAGLQLGRGPRPWRRPDIPVIWSNIDWGLFWMLWSLVPVYTSQQAARQRIRDQDRRSLMKYLAIDMHLRTPARARQAVQQVSIKSDVSAIGRRCDTLGLKRPLWDSETSPSEKPELVDDSRQHDCQIHIRQC